ncbi:MAG TPA: EscN/YscN/HrcN family type III secretion system ATPase, partial [Planctomycetaceae bacterium]|nr:EscN/YscN/HrcN family type III secretion system ATPase [Planctomycetaceae bacterium]
MLSLEEQVRHVLPVGLRGTVTRFIGLTVIVSDFPAPVGSLCHIRRDDGSSLTGEVVGFREDETVVLPYGHLGGVRLGNQVALAQSVPSVRVGPGL